MNTRRRHDLRGRQLGNPVINHPQPDPDDPVDPDDPTPEPTPDPEPTPSDNTILPQIVYYKDYTLHTDGLDNISIIFDSEDDKKNYLIAGAYFDYPGRYPKQKFSHLEKVKKFQMTPLLFDVSSTEGINNFIDNISECRSAFILIKKIGGFS